MDKTVILVWVSMVPFSSLGCLFGKDFLDALGAMQLRALIAPRGGISRLKMEFVKLAALLRVKVAGNDTVESLRARLAPAVKMLATEPWLQKGKVKNGKSVAASGWHG